MDYYDSQNSPAGMADGILGDGSPCMFQVAKLEPRWSNETGFRVAFDAAAGRL